MADVLPQTELAPGTVLDDRFRIGERLGAGSFGEVYRAEQLVFGRPLRDVALKLFKSDRVSPENVGEVLGDAVVLLELQEQDPDPAIGRHLVQVFDMGLLADGRAFMSMRLVRGRKTLMTALRRRGVDFGMPPDVAVDLIRQVLVPLAWMHTLAPPFVHGDLKPDNVLLAPDDRLVLTDFGLAARMPVGTRGGALAYQAPETLARMAGGPEVDVFAVGVMLYELLTRRHPFESVGVEARADDDQRAEIAAHLEARSWAMRPANGRDDERRIPPPSEFNEELRERPQLEAILQRCLARDPRQRYANARLLLDDLDRLQAGQRTKAVGTAPRETAPAADTTGEMIANAEAHLAAGRPEEAVKLLQPRLDDAAFPIEGLATAVRAHAAAGRLDEARALWQRANVREPGAVCVALALADIYEANGNRAAADNLRRRVR